MLETYKVQQKEVTVHAPGDLTVQLERQTEHPFVKLLLSKEQYENAKLPV